jgi:enediyne biosynthesis protein E5
MSSNVSGFAPISAGPDVVPTKMWGIDSRFIAPILITFILLAGHLSFGILESYPQTLTAIVVCIVFEIVLSYLVVGKFPHLASAYISGISAGILIRSPEFWPFALCGAIAITSKYVLRFQGRHLWNPTNFGVSFMLFVAPFAVASLSIQWGNNIYAMLVIWILGSIIIYRLRRFHITLTYVASFLLFALFRSWWTGAAFLAEVAPITGPMYQLFIFFMITDPKTTVRSSKHAQIAVAFLIALAECVLRLNENIHAPYYALFIVGPIAVLVDIFWLSKKKESLESSPSA